MEGASGGAGSIDPTKKVHTVDELQSNSSDVKQVDGSAVLTFDSKAAVITMNYGNDVDCCDSEESSPSDVEDEEERGRTDSEINCSKQDGEVQSNGDNPVETNQEQSTESGIADVENHGRENNIETETIMQDEKHPDDDEEEYSNQLARMRSERFNPFNKVPFLEENHFDSTNTSKAVTVRSSRKSSGGPASFLESGIVLDSDHDPGHSSKSSETSDTMTESSLPSSFTDFEGELINAELGLTEDHFSHPEGYFGFTKVEELQLAIENCKEMAKEAPENSEKRKELIKKLVQLRMKLQELKEGPEEEEPDTKVTLGHRFKKKTTKTAKHHCEKCTSLIWGMIQTWYRCKGCGYTCHSKCMNSITRACISGKLATSAFVVNICPESGLASQSFRCAECKNQISTKMDTKCKILMVELRKPFEGAGGEARQCDYNGLYYCEECHWNDTEIVPARVVHNWDFEPRKVSRISRQFLRLMAKRAVIKIQDINPMLFNYVEELSQIRKIREDILMMKAYFVSCKNALENRILLRLKDRQHFVDNSDMYSLQDLRDTHDGVILAELHEIHSEFARHITEECKLCHARGFICELCQSDEILFPFDTLASICPKCNAVFHRVCFSRNNGECPKCLRFAERNTESQ
ncbi:differentially expressed in FDCP 8-like isoform X2 [Ptychodera flava]